MPSFCSPGVMKWRDLIINLVSKEIKIRYMGATLGFVWSLGNPLVVTLTYYTVFTYILPSSQDRFALHLVTGVVHWMLLAQIVSQSGEWLINNGNLIRKLRFPRLLLPVSGALAIVVFWAGCMLVYASLFAMLGGVFSRALLFYPIVLIAFMALIMGFGLALSVIQVTVRDAKHFIDVFLPLLFWLTPIVWVTSSLPDGIARIAAYNPIGLYFNTFTSILHAGVVPETRDLLLCVFMGAASLLVGLLMFRKVDNVVEYL
ncbi:MULTISPECIES: ABC transporter permease [Pseudomonas syringae group]|uniref:ABC transporter permease n=1 Tax=Pseudomonas syringae group TaxID=136849 RepID=UPI0008ED26F9|nr:MULTISPECIES: ABC transporter permease [Pseudomonas syringae group]MCF5734008.1 ABC transporter permease [Pseudomonas syringae]MCF5737767.1 ABC transporter permease [Pseudomonas syringae]MCF5749168.1 ABC transporter permease [Pseudomonas syringae]MCF5754044.1 ABC transporter permease [Pseudomonas syringae]MDF5833571.1 ABC transporter permease [Pseudomonas syringae]